MNSGINQAIVIYSEGRNTMDLLCYPPSECSSILGTHGVKITNIESYAGRGLMLVCVMFLALIDRAFIRRYIVKTAYAIRSFRHRLECIPGNWKISGKRPEYIAPELAISMDWVILAFRCFKNPIWNTQIPCQWVDQHLIAKLSAEICGICVVHRPTFARSIQYLWIKFGTHLKVDLSYVSKQKCCFHS